MQNINTKNFLRSSAVALVVMMLFFFVAGAAQAAIGINRQINFQGKVVNTDGTNVATASYTFLFCIYTTASPTTACTAVADNDAVWRESKSVTVTDGIFQTNLGDTTVLPGAVDFNTDNIYLGINFNANGQMTPLVRFTAAPYALNAAKVGGLTVTDTTGTLTIPSGRTISFADAFTTSGAFATTLTATGITNVTLPTTGTLATLAGTETLTNKVSYNGLIITANTGVVTTGTWNGTDIAVADGGTGTSTGSITGTTALTFTAGGTAQNVNLVLSTTGAAVISSTTATTDTIKLQPTAGAASFAGIITTADITVSDKTYTFPNTTITVNAAGDISGTTLAANVVTSSLTTVGTLGSLAVSGAIAANGGITFDAATDTLGAHTLAGTLDANANILTNIGNIGTDFIASTGALTLAGILTANAGISLSASQSLAAAALAYVDLGLITHGTVANQGLRLPNAASATPSNPTSGEGYLAWDAAGNQLITYNGTAWATLAGGSGYNLIKDETVSLTARTTLAFLGAGVTCADNVTQTECTIAGGGSSDLQGTYGADVDGGNATISLTAADDSIVISNPASAGTDSTFTLKVEQLNTGVANDALMIDNRGTGNGLRIDDSASDTTPFIVDADGRVGIGTSSISAAAATERLLQVGSETNRGNSVTYGEVTTKGLKDINALTDIKDVFVYDTTADSDGGRWIDWATTDRLSWYTETLDDGPNDPCVIATDDRCYTQHFPRKAILVVTGSALYIFDATNNVMWMKFSQNVAGYALGADTSNDPSSVTALNGVIYVGTKGTASGGLYALDFVNDRMWNYDAIDRAGANVGISGRNAAVTYASDAKTALQLDPVGISAEWMNINDVAAVSINSSLSAITIGALTNVVPGQGQSFVALATDSGVTIINLAAQKLLQYSDVTADNYEAVALTRSGRMYALNSTTDKLEKWDAIDSDKISEVNGAFTSNWTSAVGPALAVGAVVIQTDAPDALEVVERGSLALETMDLIYVGHNLGLTEIHDHSTVTQGWSKFYNTTRQTMLMPNAIDAALPLDDASGTLAQDASFNNTDMSYKGTFTLGANGVRGKGVNLGDAGYLCSDANADGTCDNDASFNSGTAAFNISMWFKHSTTLPATPDVLFEKCYNTTPAVTVGCVTAYMTTGGAIVGAIDATTTFTQFTTYDVMATSALTYNDDQWHFLVMSRDSANDMNVYIDGQALNLSSATGQTATVDAASQVTSIGASCSAAANCATGTNFWDGSIDDFTFSSGATTVSNLLSGPARRLYNDSRPLVGKRTITVTDATTATSTTIGDAGEAWIPNEFSGLIVELTGGTGSGQSRRVIGNTTTTLTVSPAFDTTPDTTTDFEIDPESLYGASDIVNGIGITAESPLGEARMMCAGTNSGTDTGGVTCYNHQAGPNVVAEVFHADAKKLDDASAEWTGTDYDDIKSIDLSGRGLVIGSMAHTYTRTEDVRLGQGLDYLASQLFNIRGEIIQDGITLTGSLGIEIGFTGGADLAERYYSNELLSAGEVVSIDATLEAGVKKTSGAYQRDAIGIVATEPGLILGSEAANSYPIALVGRVPVKVTNENGPIYAGDRLTSSSRPGYAMGAVQSGRIIGQALGDAVDWVVCDGEDPSDRNAKLCTTVLVFVNLADYSGMPVELAMSRMNTQDTTSRVMQDGFETSSTDEALTGDGVAVRLATAEPTHQEKILAYLKQVRDDNAKKSTVSSEIFTGRLAASTEVITPTLYADQIFAKSIKADSIEGLQIFTDQIGSLQEKYAGLAAEKSGTDVSGETVGSVQEQLAIAMQKLSVDTITIQLDGSILGKLSVAGALRIGGDAQFDGDTLFAKLATFLGDTLFRGKVAFEKAPTFGADTAGFAVIEKGAKKVRITFDTPYAKQPIVAVTLTNDESPLLDGADDTLKADIKALEKDYLESVFESNVRYVVTEKSGTGFTLILSEKALRDFQFSWVAIAVEKARSFNSEKGDTEETAVTASEEGILPAAPIVPVPAAIPTDPIPEVPPAGADGNIVPTEPLVLDASDIKP